MNPAGTWRPVLLEIPPKPLGTDRLNPMEGVNMDVFARHAVHKEAMVTHGHLARYGFTRVSSQNPPKLYGNRAFVDEIHSGVLVHVARFFVQEAAFPVQHGSFPCTASGFSAHVCMNTAPTRQGTAAQFMGIRTYPNPLAAWESVPLPDRPFAAARA